MKTSALVALLLLALLPGSAAAGIWTPADSGTTEEITAVDYRADAMRYVTNNGKIFKKVGGAAGVQEASFTGRQFFDIAMSPDGSKGLAAADTGKLYRFDGTTWSEVSLANSTYDYGGSSPCSSSPEPADPQDAAPTTNLLAVAWSSNTVAWVATGATGQILKSVNGGVGWSEASRKPDRTCRISRAITDIVPIPGSDQDVYFLDDYFAGLWRTTDQLVSSGQRRDELINCYSIVFRGAVDPGSPNRFSAAGPCEGTLHWGFTSDAGTSQNYTESGGSKLRDIAGQAGVFIAAGDAGQIEQTFDGRTVFGQPADGALATKDWRAVDFLDASHAVVAGVGGAMVVSDRANEMPDVVAPTVTITGPAKVSAGAPTAFTASAVDNAGGVGIDPAGFQWTGNGLAPTTAATATYTFPAPGTYSVRVKARDLRGNVSQEATLTVTVVAPLFTFPAKPGTAKKKGKKVTLTAKGTFPLPTGLTAAQACKGKVTMRWAKGKKLLALKTVSLTSTCGFKKAVKVKRKKVGKAKKLKLRLSFAGNGLVGPGAKSYTVKVK
jgi:hypothetical protein